MSVNLKLLNAFLLVAEHGSFRRAAELSRRSQSALSLQVRELEGQLGASLFHRTTRSVGLTREGEALLPHARRAISEMEAGLRSVRAAATMKGGRLALGCPPHVATGVLPPLIAAFHREHPGVALHVRELPQAEVLEGIRRQELDFGIGPRPAEAPSLTFAPLLEEKILALAPLRLCRAAPAADPARRARPAPGGDNRRHQQHAGDGGGGGGEHRRVPRRPVRGADAGHRDGARGARLGVAVVPQLSLPENRLAGLRLLEITDPPLLREVGVVRLRGHRPSPAAAVFLRLLEAGLGAASAAGFPSRRGGQAWTSSMTFPSHASGVTAAGTSKRHGHADGKRVSASN